MICGHCGLEHELEPIPGVGWICLFDLKAQEDPVVGVININLHRSGALTSTFGAIPTPIVLKTLKRVWVFAYEQYMAAVKHQAATS